MRPSAIGWPLLTAFLLLVSPDAAFCERGGPAELAPGEVSERRPPRTEKSARAAESRALARAQRAELDSLAARLAADPADARRLHGEIVAVKRRHAREELLLHREFALRSGNAALARRIEARLASFDGGAR